MESYHGEQRRAAQQLGISLKTLHDRRHVHDAAGRPAIGGRDQSGVPVASLELSTHPLQALFDRFETGILVADDTAHYVDANAAACALMSRDRADVVGHHLSEFVLGARQTEVNVQWAAFLRDGDQAGVFPMLLPDGSTRPLQFHARANFIPGFHCSFLLPLSAPVEPTGDDRALLTVCAWTKRVKHTERWLSLEEYLQDVLGVRVTHGISPEAFEHLRPTDRKASNRAGMRS